MATVRELITIWGFKVDEKPMKKMEERITSLKGELKSTFLTASAGLATAFGLAKFTANTGEEAVKVSAKLGLSIRAWQEYTHVAGLANMSNEELATGFRFMIQNASQVKRGMGGDAGKAFKRLGVNVKDANGKIKDTDTLFTEVIGGLHNVKDAATQIDLTRAIFGRGGDSFTTIAKGGTKEMAAFRKEAEELGAVMSDEAAKAAEEFNDNFFRGTQVLKGFRNEMGNELIPVFNDMILATIKYVRENRAMIRTNLKGFAKGAGSAIKGAATAIFAIAKGINAVVVGTIGWERATKLLIYTWASFKAFKIITSLFGIGKSLYTILSPILRLIPFMRIFAGIGRVISVVFSEVGLVIALAGAYIQDFVYFFQGKKSALGEVVRWIKTFKGIGGDIGGMFHQNKAPMITRPRYIQQGGKWQTNNNNANINAPITVNVPGGMGIDAAKQATENGVKNAMDSFLRGAGRDFNPIVEH